MRNLDEIVARAQALMEMAEQPGTTFSPFPAHEALDLAQAVVHLSKPRAEAATPDRNAILEEAEDAMLGAFADMSAAYLFTSGFDNRIIDARDAIRALRTDMNSPRSEG